MNLVATKMVQEIPVNEIALARNQEWVTTLDSGANNVFGSMTTFARKVLLVR